MTKKRINPRNAYGETLVELGKKYPNIVVLDADLSKSTKTIMFAKKYPERFFDMGIAEANMISTAAGLASCGKIPFASTFAVFATGRVYDQIRMDVAYSKANVKIFATHGGISVGKDGASHQMIEDLALMRVLPNMTVLTPSDAPQTKKIVELMASTEGPMYARVGRASAPVIYKYEDLKNLRIGEGIVVEDGDDVSIIACGTMVDPALDARKKLLKENDIHVRVIDMHTIKPLDKKLICKCARETNAIITVEEHSIIGGLGSAVSELLAEEGFSIKFKRMGVKDTFCESGDPKDLLEKYELNEKHIVKTVRQMI
ncbi:MAG: transketolase family protein [Thermoplasmata archaeon]|nr:MAG: transketolase family protein [Thermoplasmata archaeon]RLF36817.1 MAG: transketolase family protein [Thermoplasmata archaeon]